MQKVKQQKLSLKKVEADLDKKKKDYDVVQKELKAYQNAMSEGGQAVVNEEMQSEEILVELLIIT